MDQALGSPVDDDELERHDQRRHHCNERPTEYNSIGRPRIVFTGVVQTEKIDLELLTQLRSVDFTNAPTQVNACRQVRVVCAAAR